MQQPPCNLLLPSQISELIQRWASVNAPFAAALRNGTFAAEALGRLGIRLCQEDKVADAVEVFRAAAAIAPGNPSCWMNLAVALDRVGLLFEATSCLENSLRIADQQPAAWLLLGAIRVKRLDLAGAEDAYLEALRLDGGSSLAWHCLGLVKQERGELADAIECFSACVARGGKSAGVLANLGKLYYQVGLFTESTEMYGFALELDQANTAYRQMQRRAQFLRDLRDGPVEDAIMAHLRSLTGDTPEAEHDMNAELQNAVTMLSGFGHRDAALRVGMKWTELAPGSESARYLLKSMTGEAGLERSPAEYIVEYFDRFSEGFDEKLVKVLRYDVPTQLGAILASVVGTRRHFDTLEIGCGTGLCGPLLRPFSRELIGVDLSPKMLEQAKRRNAYDALYCEELLTFLQRSHARFDLIVAADVLIYFGDLCSIWAAAGNALKPGGLLICTTESMGGDGYRLGSSGRFSHSLEYLRSTTAGLFEERARVEFTIREEATKPIRGDLLVLARAERKAELLRSKSAA